MGEGRGVKSPSVERITWATMEAVMARYAGGGDGLYAVLYPFIEQARAEAFEERDALRQKGGS